MPTYLSVFSAENVKFAAELDFTECIELAFLIYKEAGVKLALVDNLDYVKIGGDEPARGLEAKALIEKFIDLDRQNAMHLVKDQMDNIDEAAKIASKN